ncbi:hypothetical protein OH77DRAFT_1425776 [Trametes cingulata]|nr:hypothetical protein OH77DRAFT_1425776 [Trametes cingulata]
MLWNARRKATGRWHTVRWSYQPSTTAQIAARYPSNLDSRTESNCSHVAQSNGTGPPMAFEHKA